MESGPTLPFKCHQCCSQCSYCTGSGQGTRSWSF